jgi:hypothetical protein
VRPVIEDRAELIAAAAALSDARARHQLLGGSRAMRYPEAVRELYAETVRLTRVDLRRAARLAESAGGPLGGRLSEGRDDSRPSRRGRLRHETPPSSS